MKSNAIANDISYRKVKDGPVRKHHDVAELLGKIFVKGLFLHRLEPSVHRWHLGRSTERKNGANQIERIAERTIGYTDLVLVMRPPPTNDFLLIACHDRMSRVREILDFVRDELEQIDQLFGGVVLREVGICYKQGYQKGAARPDVNAKFRITNTYCSNRAR